MAKVILKGFIMIPELELAAVKNALKQHKQLTMAESGCEVFSVTPDSENPLKYHVYEEFSDQEAFDFHQARVKESQWGKVSINVTRHYKISTC